MKWLAGANANVSQQTNDDQAKCSCDFQHELPQRLYDSMGHTCGQEEKTNCSNTRIGTPPLDRGLSRQKC